jgi:hypothetical protein
MIRHPLSDVVAPMRLRRHFCCFLLYALTTLIVPLPSSVAAPFTGWDFEDGTLQGWSNVSTATVGPTQYIALTDNDVFSATAWKPLGSRTGGVGTMAAVDPFGVRDSAHDAPLVLRSPTFSLAGGGQIIAHLLGGTPGAIAVTPGNFSEVTGPSLNTNGSSPGGDASYIALALRRESDGAYLLHRSRTGNDSGYSGWQQVTFSEADLESIIANNPGELFTLDLIDTAHGSFGSIALDSVTIPVASRGSLVAGGGLWTIEERVSASPFGSIDTSKVDIDALLALPSGDPGIASEAVGTATVIDFHGSGASGHFDGDSPFLIGGNYFVSRVTGQIEVIQGGDITFGFYANDGGRLLIDGVVVAEDDYSDIASDTLGTINLAPGLHNVEFIYFERTGGDTVELYVATTTGTFTSLNQGSFELLQAAMVAVPEPASLALALVAGLSLVARGSTIHRHRSSRSRSA